MRRRKVAGRGRGGHAPKTVNRLSGALIIARDSAPEFPHAEDRAGRLDGKNFCPTTGARAKIEDRLSYTAEGQSRARDCRSRPHP